MGKILAVTPRAGVSHKWPGAVTNGHRARSITHPRHCGPVPIEAKAAYWDRVGLRLDFGARLDSLHQFLLRDLAVLVLVQFATCDPAIAILVQFGEQPLLLLLRLLGGSSLLLGLVEGVHFTPLLRNALQHRTCTPILGLLRLGGHSGGCHTRSTSLELAHSGGSATETPYRELEGCGRAHDLGVAVAFPMAHRRGVAYPTRIIHCRCVEL